MLRSSVVGSRRGRPLVVADWSPDRRRLRRWPSGGRCTAETRYSKAPELRICCNRATLDDRSTPSPSERLYANRPHTITDNGGNASETLVRFVLMHEL